MCIQFVQSKLLHRPHNTLKLQHAAGGTRSNTTGSVNRVTGNSKQDYVFCRVPKIKIDLTGFTCWKGRSRTHADNRFKWHFNSVYVLM